MLPASLRVSEDLLPSSSGFLTTSSRSDQLLKLSTDLPSQSRLLSRLQEPASCLYRLESI